METVRKRRTIQKTPATKTARLEEKLDGLVSLLKSQATPTPTDNFPQSAQSAQCYPTPESLQSFPASLRAETSQIPRTNGETGLHKTWHRDKCAGDGTRLHSPVIDPTTSYTACGSRTTIYHSPGASLAPGLEPSLDEAEGYLKDFRAKIEKFFPFLIVLPFTTAQEVYRERPFLWLCIMASSSKYTIQQKTLGREIRLAIGREMLLEGKNNLELLLGILTYVAWYVS